MINRVMALAGCSTFRSDLLFRLHSKHLVIDTVGLAKNVAFPVLRVNRKPRFRPKGYRDETILNYEEVMKETEARGIILPLDMVETARSDGIHKLFLLRYLRIRQVLGFATRLSRTRNQIMMIKLGSKSRGITPKEMVSALLRWLVRKKVVCTLLYYACVRRQTPISDEESVEEFQHSTSMSGAKMYGFFVEVFDWFPIVALYGVCLLHSWNKLRWDLARVGINLPGFLA